AVVPSGVPPSEPSATAFSTQPVTVIVDPEALELGVGGTDCACAPSASVDATKHPRTAQLKRLMRTSVSVWCKSRSRAGCGFSEGAAPSAKEQHLRRRSSTFREA